MNNGNIDIKPPEVISMDQPGWLKTMRESAWKVYKDTSLPSRIPQLWRFTDPEKFLYTENGSNELKDTEIPEYVSAELSSGKSSVIVFNNSAGSVKVLMSEEAEKAGVIAGDLSTIVRDNKELTEPYLGKIVNSRFGKFEALNLAAWGSGIFLYIPENTVIKEPLHLINHIPDNGSFTLRTLIIADKLSEATVIDDVRGGSEKSNNDHTNIVTEVFAKESSNLNYINAQMLNSGSNIFHTCRNRIDNNAKSVTAIAGLGGKTTKANYGGMITGEGAESRLLGFVIGIKKKHFDHYTVHDHYAQHTDSNMDFRVVLSDKAQSSCVGRINIEHDALFSTAYQENKNLVLSPKCKVESIPELEIKTDEVRCSHGATMGPPDKDQIFYLKSRGINEKDAVQLITEGFMEDSLRQLPGKVRNILTDYISASLSEME
ncbi:MAG: SufD family Fe-S cluster assembly protein [bacterium]|nr:SufD family Fe-S cluster assembly protein [bacterium]